MIQDPALRWAVTTVFGLCVVAFVVAMAGSRRRRIDVVGQALHVLMAAAMAVMAWPGGAKLPTTPPMVFFLGAAAWFLVLALGPAGAGHRVINAYHSVMMAAMAWMYALMNGHLLPGRPAHHLDSMPGMPDMQAATAREGGPAWLAAVNWAVTIGFALASVAWAARYATRRHRDSTDCADRRSVIAGQAMMAAGMALMFGVTL